MHKVDGGNDPMIGVFTQSLNSEREPSNSFVQGLEFSL